MPVYVHSDRGSALESHDNILYLHYHGFLYAAIPVFYPKFVGWMSWR